MYSDLCIVFFRSHSISNVDAGSDPKCDGARTNLINPTHRNEDIPAVKAVLLNPTGMVPNGLNATETHLILITIDKVPLEWYFLFYLFFFFL